MESLSNQSQVLSSKAAVTLPGMGSELDHSWEGHGEGPTCKSQGSLCLSHLTWEKGSHQGQRGQQPMGTGGHLGT